MARRKTDDEYNENRKMASSSSDLETPFFASIKKKITKRLSPYPETELWEHDNRKRTHSYAVVLKFY